MESFGRYLRAEREAREVTIEDLSRTTKIGRQILQAIEADDFAKLPPPVFVRGFVRTVCKTMKLPDDDVVRRYDDYVATHRPGERAAGQEGAAASAPFRAARSAGETRPGPGMGAPAPRQSFGKLPFFLAVAALLGAMVFAYRPSSPPAPSPARLMEPPSAAPGSVPAEPPESSQSPRAAVPGAALEALPASGAAPSVEQPAGQSAGPIGAEAGATASPVPAQGRPALAPPPPAPSSGISAGSVGEGAESRVVTLRARGACWVQITADDRPPREFILQEGEAVSQRYAEKLTLRVGNPVNLGFESDGKRYDVIATQARPMRWDFPLSPDARQRLEALRQAAPGAETPADPKKSAPKPAPPPAPAPASQPAAGSAVPSAPFPAPSQVPSQVPSRIPPGTEAAPTSPGASGAAAPGSASGAR